MVEPIYFKCFCGRIHIKIPIVVGENRIYSPTICGCGSDHYDRLSQKEVRKLKLEEIERGR